MSFDLEGVTTRTIDEELDVSVNRIFVLAPRQLTFEGSSTNVAKLVELVFIVLDGSKLFNLFTGVLT